MKVSEAIEELTVKRDNSLGFQKLYASGDRGWTANKYSAAAYNTAINTLKQIDEPQAEKLVVPEFVAEWYETNKASIERAVSMQIQHGFTPLVEPRSKFDMWFFDESNHPIETLIRMKDGYTVKPKRWVVKYLRHRCYYYFVEWANTDTFDPIGGPDLDYLKVAEFTDIKKAEAVATLVDGSVEEV